MSESTLPNVLEFLDDVDERLMRDISYSPVMTRLYRYFSSDIRPLNPREFLEFMSSLSATEKMYYFFAC